MVALRVRVVGLVCLAVLMAGLAGGLTVEAQEARNSPFDSAQDRLRDGERPVLPGAEPALPDGGGGTTFGTAPDLSVFSVMKFAGTLKDTSGEPRTGAVGITFAFYSEQTGGAPLWLETQNI